MRASPSSERWALSATVNTTNPETSARSVRLRTLRANVPAKDWWRPVVKADGAASSVESFVSGQVYNTAGNATHDLEPVTQPCAPPGTAAQEGTCPWRQHVFLQQHVLLEMDFKSHFNLNRALPAAAATAGARAPFTPLRSLRPQASPSTRRL